MHRNHIPAYFCTKIVHPSETMINFQTANWFNDYLHFRKHHPLQFDHVNKLAERLQESLADRFTCLDNPLYAVLQQSGLIYGFPVHYPFQSANGTLDKLQHPDRAKLILLDIMVHAQLLEKELPTGAAYELSVEQTGQFIRNYYSGIHQYAHIEAPELLEQILFQRVHFKKNYFDFRKTGISSQLFWDLYCFLDYCKAVQKPDFQESIYFPQIIHQKIALKKLSLQLIAATAFADHRIASQEKSLLLQFERSSKLLLEKEREDLRVIFENGVQLDQLVIPALSWMARRFLLDICLLAIHVDAAVDPLEEAFLKPLLEKLQLTPDDLLSSKADLGCFLYLHGEQLHFFKGKKTGILLLGQAVVENFVKLGYAAKMEAVETRDMALTFGKLLVNKLHLSKNSELPDEEAIKAALSQLKDIPKFIPFFSVIFLPVPGITEAYILLAFSLEKLSGGMISLLPSQIRKVVKGEKTKKK